MIDRLGANTAGTSRDCTGGDGIHVGHQRARSRSDSRSRDGLKSGRPCRGHDGTRLAVGSDLGRAGGKQKGRREKCGEGGLIHDSFHSKVPTKRNRGTASSPSHHLLNRLTSPDAERGRLALAPMEVSIRASAWPPDLPSRCRRLRVFWLFPANRPPPS